VYDVSVSVMRELGEALSDTLGEAQPAACPLRFGSWVGADRDGNPNVKPETTALALRLQAREVLAEYLIRVTALSHQLTFSSLLCQPSPELLASLESEDSLLNEQAFSDSPNRFSHEPYRRKLYAMRLRLERSLRGMRKRLVGQHPDNAGGGYRSEREISRRSVSNSRLADQSRRPQHRQR